jgi:tellurite resistance protein TehA-like permease
MNPEFAYSIGRLFQASFEILPVLGNLPNVIFIVIGFILLFYWLKEMSRYKKEAQEKGTYE